MPRPVQLNKKFRPYPVFQRLTSVYILENHSGARGSDMPAHNLFPPSGSDDDDYDDYLLVEKPDSDV